MKNKTWGMMSEGSGALFLTEDAYAAALGVTVVDRQGTEAHVYLDPRMAADLAEWLRAWAAERMPAKSP